MPYLCQYQIPTVDGAPYWMGEGSARTIASGRGWCDVIAREGVPMGGGDRRPVVAARLVNPDGSVRYEATASGAQAAAALAVNAAFLAGRYQEAMREERARRAARRTVTP